MSVQVSIYSRAYMNFMKALEEKGVFIIEDIQASFRVDRIHCLRSRWDSRYGPHIGNIYHDPNDRTKISFIRIYKIKGVDVHDGLEHFESSLGGWEDVSVDNLDEALKHLSKIIEINDTLIRATNEAIKAFNNVFASEGQITSYL